MTEPVKIRPARVEDAAALAAIYAPYVAETAISFEYEPPTAEEFAKRIARTLQQYPYLVAEMDGRIAGYIYAGPMRTRPAYAWTVETSIYLDRACRRKGLGKRLYAALEGILQLQGYTNSYACITATDAPEDPYMTNDSFLFHQSIGYQLVGSQHHCGYKFDRWYHIIWMEKYIAPHRSPQPPVIPFSQLDPERYAEWLS